MFGCDMAVIFVFVFISQVTHYSMWLLVSWAHCSSTVKSSLADSDHLHDWLKKLTLLVPEVSQFKHALPPLKLNNVHVFVLLTAGLSFITVRQI